MITITENAAKKVKELVEKEKKGPEYGLRVGVRGGGCSGMTYLLDLDTQKPDDSTLEEFGVKVFVDRKSLLYISGSQIDYQESLMGSGFKIENPNVKGSCGCGHSFEV